MPLKTELYLNKIKYNSLSKIFGNCIKHKINLVAFLNSKTKQFSSYFQWLKRVDNKVDARNKNQNDQDKGSGVHRPTNKPGTSPWPWSWIWPLTRVLTTSRLKTHSHESCVIDKKFAFGINSSLFIRCDCDCDFFIASNGLCGIQFKCSNRAIVTMTPSPIWPISCDE